MIQRKKARPAFFRFIEITTGHSASLYINAVDVNKNIAKRNSHNIIQNALYGMVTTKAFGIIRFAEFIT